ncbi:hypothetical protein SAMN05446935_4057 [Burkholderia sp. YR290]|jgi:hypothetical protein|nr:hypothetical protein SAMN05446935_4057 [Burkholderia sp. YR290]
MTNTVPGNAPALLEKMRDPHSGQKFRSILKPESAMYEKDLGCPLSSVKIGFRNTEESRHDATARLLAIEAITVGDECGISIELKFHGAAGASPTVLLGHVISPRQSGTKESAVSFRNTLFPSNVAA